MVGNVAQDTDITQVDRMLEGIDDRVATAVLVAIEIAETLYAATGEETLGRAGIGAQNRLIEDRLQAAVRGLRHVSGGPLRQHVGRRAGDALQLARRQAHKTLV